MSRRKPGPRPAATSSARESCPCGLPAPYAACCGALHRGTARAAGPEQLMRSRYSAFVVRDEAYLLRSWHSTTRPPGVEFDPGLRWVRLEIVGSSGGSAFHSEGTVKFRAHFTDGGQAGELHENSRFVREDGSWVYLDGDVAG